MYEQIVSIYMNVYTNSEYIRVPYFNAYESGYVGEFAELRW